MDLGMVGVAGFLCLILLMWSGGVWMVVDAVTALLKRRNGEVV